MAGRRRSTSELPRAPLELLHPLAVQGGEVPAADILGEPLGAYAATAHTLLRAGLAWSADPARADDVLPAPPLRRMEEALLRFMRHDPAAAPFAVLAGALATAGADRSEAARACLCISDWALERNATHTALAYAQLAALVWPRHARYAWIAARLLRSGGRLRESEQWLRRAHRIAVWTDDRESEARALSSLGNLHLSLGRYPAAQRMHMRALRVSRRHSLRTLEGEASHDLFVVHADMGNPEAAESFAVRAYTLYRPSHERMLRLAHDVGQFWNLQGYYWRAIAVFSALLPRHGLPDDGIREFAGACRAFGGTGNTASFEQCARKVWTVAENISDLRTAAGALYEVGVGAESLKKLDDARRAFSRALELASSSKSADIVTRAETALAALSADGPTGQVPVTRKLRHQESGDTLARDIARSLELSPVAAC